MNLEMTVSKHRDGDQSTYEMTGIYNRFKVSLGDVVLSSVAFDCPLVAAVLGG